MKAKLSEIPGSKVATNPSPETDGPPGATGPATHGAALAVPRGPHLPVARPIDVIELFHGASTVTLLARVEDWTLRWAGRITCDLHLSIGVLPVIANRDTLPLDIRNGDWVRAKFLRRYGPPAELKLLRATQFYPDSSEPTSWIPTAQYHRVAHMHRLLALLSQLEPGLQAVFMATMQDSRAQRGFFLRPAASDHHSYPGGLFDQSVEAAERVFNDAHASRRERDAATLAALLFDLGKVLDPCLSPDKPRLEASLEAHPRAPLSFERALATVSGAQPDLADALRDLMVAPRRQGPAWSVRQAVQASWRLEEHAADERR